MLVCVRVCACVCDRTAGMTELSVRLPFRYEFWCQCPKRFCVTVGRCDQALGDLAEDRTGCLTKAALSRTGVTRGVSIDAVQMCHCADMNTGGEGKYMHMMLPFSPHD